MVFLIRIPIRVVSMKSASGRYLFKQYLEIKTGTPAKHMIVTARINIVPGKGVMNPLEVSLPAKILPLLIIINYCSGKSTKQIN
jgi:hypothetical protein